MNLCNDNLYHDNNVDYLIESSGRNYESLTNVICDFILIKDLHNRTFNGFMGKS